ncbi:hypothetical protein KIN20_020353 [Parelaphostrongylus tenuis]|uniref:Uncharacterized protein n=1 Tax=Parelaphostrongylus tenuis TaxID=148309 RepID=A0AAD5N346_PARTN|nr:hypothetical protein KIN20_020353 [Parelaphostrongylus tenuis]
MDKMCNQSPQTKLRTENLEIDLHTSGATHNISEAWSKHHKQVQMTSCMITPMSYGDYRAKKRPRYGHFRRLEGPRSCADEGRLS